MSTEPASEALADTDDASPELDILRALERGDIDVAEATRRLAALADGDDPTGTDHVG
jgi:hypothetical protein